MKPLAIDLYCGLGGWTEGLLVEGYRVVGFDIERHRYPARDFSLADESSKAPLTGAWHEYPAQLVLQDVLTLHGSQFKGAALIVASPPCQEFSYMAMPWSRAKQIAAEYRSGVRDVKKLTALFDACFRIQREASEAAGHHIPLVVENVCGAQKWVGRARWHFGSFYLWGDVPALMPIVVKHRATGGHEWTTGFDKHTKNDGGSWFNIGSPGQKVTNQNPVNRQISEGWRMKRYDETEKMALATDGVKQRGSGREWFAGDGKISRMTSSKSNARKAASAQIAKIPFVLSQHIARVYYPQEAR